MKLSEHFTLEECTYSYTALKFNIDNSPSAKAVNNLKKLVIKCLEPIRQHFNSPVIISSAYRCLLLNRLIKGAKTSQHCFGEAADFIVKDVPIDEVIEWIRNNIEFDQLIDEYSGNKHWIHISYREGQNRKQVLKYKNKVYVRYDK